MTNDTDRKRPPLSRRIHFGIAAVGLLAIGGVAGTVASHALHPPIEMAPLHPVPIASLPKADGVITIRGRVAETYGNKFVIDDGSARTLVDTGREGDERTLVSDGMSVAVQGRFDRGFVHASFLVDQSGKVTALRPMDGPGHGNHRPPPPRPDEAGAPRPVSADAPSETVADVSRGSTAR